MTTLADRLRAAIDETEAVARAAGGTWVLEGDRNELLLNFGKHTTSEIGFYEDDALRPAEARHIARHDPAAVLRRCAADRKILDAYEHADRMAGSGISPEGNYANGLEFAVREIAEAYGVEV